MILIKIENLGKMNLIKKMRFCTNIFNIIESYIFVFYTTHNSIKNIYIFLLQA